MARSGPGSVTGLLSSCTAPLSGRIMPPARLRMVDLPQPEGPTTTTNSPGRHSRVTFSTAERVVFWKRLEMPRRERLPRPLEVRRGGVKVCGAVSSDIEGAYYHISY